MISFVESAERCLISGSMTKSSTFSSAVMQTRKKKPVLPRKNHDSGSQENKTIYFSERDLEKGKRDFRSTENFPTKAIW